MPRNNDRRRRDRGGRRGPPGRTGGGQGRPRVANSQAVDNTPVPEGIVFYCKTCQQIVDYHPTSFNFKYPIEACQKAKSASAAVTPEATATTAATETGDDKGRDRGDRRRAEPTCDIAYGTERSIKQYYKIKDDKYDAERRAREEKAARADKL